MSLRAAKEALLRVMPDSQAKALPAYDLFQAAQVPTGGGRTGRESATGAKALRELLSEGKIQSIGKGVFHDPVQYWATGTGALLDTTKRPASARPIHIPEQVRNSEQAAETRKPKHISRTKQNSALLKTMRGEEASEE